MTDYRLYIFDGSGKIKQADWLLAEDDDEAVRLVRAMKKSGQSELWERNRLVATIARHSADQSESD